ncbi:DUF2190 family protein [Cohaesibacter celericrescens]|uniref:DUF2190 domain-containing protein n=1 Tax=Cohaesibacter celericrescens TaxID=2067669 RepID=A0A2N5XXA7_9HYPH|nr:DUF2190 family protein [Cohaesibacter celericrescens]PLW79075.1 hypothetical protein C0081_02255 [Cohaesibacter celericrescens]
MAQNKIRNGVALDLAAPVGGVVSGAAVLIGAFFGVAGDTVEATETFVLHTEGVWELPCKSADVVSVGDVLYWDDTAKELTKTSTANTKVGIAYTSAADTVVAVQIKLIPGLGA